MLYHIDHEEAPKVYPVNWLPISSDEKGICIPASSARNTYAIGTRLVSGTSIMYSIAIMKNGKKFHHVSFARPDGKYPDWDEMVRELRKLPWLDKDRAIMMVIPPEKEYINFNPTCFHWWQAMD